MTTKDVMGVANELKVNLTEDQVTKVLEMYDGEAQNYPTATWDLIVEDCIHQVLSFD